MKKLLICLGVISLTLSAFAQKKKFREDFTDNEAEWFVGKNDDFEIALDSGKYWITAKQNDKPKVNPLIIYGKIDLNRPFDIETRIKHVSSKGTQNSYGLVLGERDRGNAHYFVVSQELRMSWWYRLSLWRNKVIKNEPLLLTTFKNEEPEGTKFFIKYRDGNLYFYINDKYVTKVSRPKFWLGNGVGLFVSPGMQVAVDYLELKEW